VCNPTPQKYFVNFFLKKMAFYKLVRNVYKASKYGSASLLTMLNRKNEKQKLDEFNFAHVILGEKIPLICISRTRGRGV
jgi:hypothetical protein